VAREELGLARPGDHPVILLWPEPRSSTSSVPPDARPQPHWMGWLRLFADLDALGQ
jgi:hypothetical protein